MPKRELSFSQFEIAHLDIILPVLEQVFREHAIDFYILGGLARDIHFLREGLTPQRITRDIDLAAFIPNPPDYELLLKDLIRQEGFERISNNPVRLRHPSGVVVDILPFNEMTSNDAEMVRYLPIDQAFKASLAKYIETPSATIFSILSKEMKKSPEEVLEYVKAIKTGLEENVSKQ